MLEQTIRIDFQIEDKAYINDLVVQIACYKANLSKYAFDAGMHRHCKEMIKLLNQEKRYYVKEFYKTYGKPKAVHNQGDHGESVSGGTKDQNVFA